jgi:hypothetical protein
MAGRLQPTTRLGRKLRRAVVASRPRDGAGAGAVMSLRTIAAIIAAVALSAALAVRVIADAAHQVVELEFRP